MYIFLTMNDGRIIDTPIIFFFYYEQYDGKVLDTSIIF